jgi:polyisoprenoid-binding protein YceI
VRRALKWLISAIVAAVLLVAALVGWYVFGARVPAKPKLDAASNTRGGPPTPFGSWHVVPGKNVYAGYRIKELFGDALLKRDAVGQTNAVHGTLTIAPGRVRAAVITADLTRLGSDRPARDAYVRDTSLETNKYPTARFTLTAPIALPARAAKGTKLHLRASGRLLLHGVTRPVTFQVDARWNGPTIDVVGTAPIVLADYRIRAPDTVIARVEDHGSIEFDLTFATGAR